MPLLHSDMQDEHCVLRRTIKVVANICAGNRQQVQQVLALDATSRVTPTGRIFPLLVDLHARAPSTHLDIVEEVVWAINNASHGASASDGDFQVMKDDGCFAALEYSISPSVATQDTDGAILWQRLYEGTLGDWGSQTIELGGDDLLIGGIWAWGFAEEDIWLQRTSPLGLIEDCRLIRDTDVVPLQVEITPDPRWISARPEVDLNLGSGGSQPAPLVDLELVSGALPLDPGG